MPRVKNDKKELIQKAIEERRTTLTGEEAKIVLKNYGIPVVKEIVVKSIDQIDSVVNTIGYHVVVKGLGARLTRKTEKAL